MGKLCLTGASGKLGGAVLKALLNERMIDHADIVISTSSDLNSDRLKDIVGLENHSIDVRHATYDDPVSLEKAFAGCEKLLLVSTPAIHMDFNNAPPGEGREKHHFKAITAAKKAGVAHVYYTSLAFGEPSAAGVMTAHLRTEAFLQELTLEGNMTYTIIREGLYCKSWPLYLGFYDLGKDTRSEVPLAGDGRVAWASIHDLGIATACILTAPSEKYARRKIYLTGTEMLNLLDVAALVAKKENRDVRVKLVFPDVYKQVYVAEGKEGVKGNSGLVNWWSGTYEALKAGECAIEDNT